MASDPYDAARFDAACRKFGATPDDMRRLIVLAAQRNHVLVGNLRLGALKHYANNIVKSVAHIEDGAYRPGVHTTREQAARRAAQIREEIVLQPPVSPDAARRIR